LELAWAYFYDWVMANLKKNRIANVFWNLDYLIYEWF